MEGGRSIYVEYIYSTNTRASDAAGVVRWEVGGKQRKLRAMTVFTRKAGELLQLGDEGYERLSSFTVHTDCTEEQTS